MRSLQEKLEEIPDPMTPEQLASVWAVSPDTIRGMCDRSELRCFRAGKLWKITKAAVVEHMAGGEGEVFHVERSPT